MREQKAQKNETCCSQQQVSERSEFMNETYETKYGNATYIVRRSFSPNATETINDKIKRLILKDLDKLIANQHNI